MVENSERELERGKEIRLRDKENIKEIKRIHVPLYDSPSLRTLN
jgi:hypothetical protein